jgi:hypothetical protein
VRCCLFDIDEEGLYATVYDIFNCISWLRLTLFAPHLVPSRAKQIPFFVPTCVDWLFYLAPPCRFLFVVKKKKKKRSFLLKEEGKTQKRKSRIPDNHSPKKIHLNCPVTSKLQRRQCRPDKHWEYDVFYALGKLIKCSDAEGGAKLFRAIGPTLA